MDGHLFRRSRHFERRRYIATTVLELQRLFLGMTACGARVTLSAADIPGADLSEPFESYTVPQLRW